MRYVAGLLWLFTASFATEDIDFLVEEHSLPRIRELTQQMGFRWNPTPLLLKDGGVIIHRLFKGKGEDLVVLDLLLVIPSTAPAWASRHEVTTDFGPIRVCSPAGLIHLKSLRRSGQDEDDIQRLKEVNHES